MTSEHLQSSSGDRALRVALIGCGAVAELYHGPVLKQLVQTGAIQVVVLVDPVPERLACLARQFGDAKGVPRVEDRSFSEVDIAIVASPPRWHEQQVVQLLRMGIHVLCEKPMAVTLKEAERMVDASREANRLLSLGLFRRFFPTSLMIKELIDGRSLGSPLSVEWREGGLFDWPAASASFFTKNSSGGGVFADMGTHALDLLIWWFGEPDAVNYEDDAMGGLEANAIARFNFRTGVSAALRLSRDTTIPNGTRVNFEAGSVWFQGASADSLVVETKSSKWLLKGRLHEKPVSRSHGFGDAAPGYHHAFVAQMKNFVGAVRGIEALKVTAAEALRVQDWIERGYAARRLMNLPWFTSSETAHARRLAGRTDS